MSSIANNTHMHLYVDKVIRQLAEKRGIFTALGKIIAVKGLAFVEQMAKVDMRFKEDGEAARPSDIYMMATIVGSMFERMYATGCLDEDV